MNATTKLAALKGLVQAAAEATMNASDDLRADADTLANGNAGDTTTSECNFAVGALLPIEQLAKDLLALVEAARVLNGIRS